MAQYVTVLLVVQPGGSPRMTLLSASALGVALGLINAGLIHGLRAPSIIITLATLNLYQGLLTGLSGGRWVYELPPWFQRLGTWQLRLWPGATEGGLSVGALVLAGVVLGTGVMLRWSVLSNGLTLMRVPCWAPTPSPPGSAASTIAGCCSGPASDRGSWPDSPG